MKTDISNYILAAILLIIMEEKEVYLVVFHFHMFKATELNYDIYDKELLVIFKAFHTWHYYLKGSELPIDVITDHKNLVYIYNSLLLLNKIVGISLLVQPHHLLPSQISRIQT